MEKTKEERIRNFIDKMRQERGYLPPAWPYAAEKDVDFMEVYNAFYNSAMNTEDVLPIKTKELIAIAIVAFRGMEMGMEPHINRALRYGATKEEIFEALKVSMVFGGAPTFAIGLEGLVKIEEEDKNA
jgi:AhpD family alkylhydroperoxidase